MTAWAKPRGWAHEAIAASGPSQTAIGTKSDSGRTGNDKITQVTGC